MLVRWAGAGLGWGTVAEPAVLHLVGSAVSRYLCMQVLALPSGEQDWKELFSQEDDEGTPCPAEDELALQDNGFLSKNEVLRIKVSRLTERLRKRYPTNNFGMAKGAQGWGRMGWPEGS